MLEDTLRTLLAPVEATGIPFVVVFGNHDYEAPISIREQVKIFESYDNCLAVSFGKNSTEDGAFVLPIYPKGSELPAMALYFFDSGSYLADQRKFARPIQVRALGGDQLGDPPNIG